MPAKSSYSLLFRIASGAAFGPDQPVILHLIEIPDEKAMNALHGVCMELDDCAFPLLKGIVPTSNLDEGFKGVNWALLVGAVPRKAGMERKDLLGINGKIFTGQGKCHCEKMPRATCACSSSAIRAIRMRSSLRTMRPVCRRERFFRHDRALDENRAKSQLAKKSERGRDRRDQFGDLGQS
ncbi:MAG: hypothetical protein WDM76_00295 [Limisphaerales bacterium]